jgi:hypothetical protein
MSSPRNYRNHYAFEGKSEKYPFFSQPRRFASNVSYGVMWRRATASGKMRRILEAPN